MNDLSMTIRGKDRYKVRRDGIQEDGLLEPDYEAQGY